jgi:hypothetical protein
VTTTILSENFRRFPQSLEVNAAVLRQVVHKFFFPNFFQFIAHFSS